MSTWFRNEAGEFLVLFEKSVLLFEDFSAMSYCSDICVYPLPCCMEMGEGGGAIGGDGGGAIGEMGRGEGL